MTSIPSFVIIIPVFHSIEDLGRCLSSLEGLDYPKEAFHVVLVDCHMVNGVRQFATERLPKYALSASLVCLPERARIGPDWLIEWRMNEARNYAVQRVAGRCYVFTEDDCTFEADWLHKIEAALTDEVGAIGGPDILPGGMSWSARVIDCVLNSFLGTAGMRGGDGCGARRYHPRKQNMAVPAWVLNRVGTFSEERPLAGEIEMASRIRVAGLEIKFLPDNPVWHRRVTTFRNFLRLTAYTASEKVRLMRDKKTFIQSSHFFIIVAGVLGTVIGAASLVSSHLRVLFVILAAAYLVGLLSTAVASAVRTRSVPVGFGVLMFLPSYHFSLTFGTTKGALTPLNRGGSGY